MIKIKMNRGRGHIDIDGPKVVVLAETAAIIANLLKEFNNDEIKIIMDVIQEVADE